jgi:hypothetical protein
MLVVVEAPPGRLTRKAPTMSKPRKTVNVAETVAKFNDMIAATAANGLGPDVREGLIAAVEYVLTAADAYRGFQFTDGNVGDTDRTMRRYYVPGA